MNISTALAANRTGRILLHVSCILRRPRHAEWHCRGILREVDGSATLRAWSLLAALIVVLRFPFV